ncbi:hypothetical protein NP493_332g01000 [Ridgeia piscesae]|uniref:Density-regulated protein n=1 Tax=Ridgeia piscesae TaxID=27915 RepID=A0AAD9L5D8_RIDPI|nr:hypothetical protein NP493_332g01000 [Ridgeia piscesae]
MSEGDTAVASAEESKFFTYDGPNPKLTYPLKVIYCDVCDGWPLEYVEHHPNYEKAKEWMEKNLSDDLLELYLGDKEEAESGDGTATGGKKKRQSRGGRGMIKTKKKQDQPQRVCLSRAPRGKKKYVTVITGLATYDINLKTASKFFASSFSCGSSVTGDDEIVIQGDVKDDLFDIISEKWPQIDEECIDDLGDMKR